MTSDKTARFVVHEHKASRLHYDFRLELGGALKSWAVPKGPSLNPADKRLAVMVPDHTLEYIDYEGVIPEGRAGAGPVVIWDTGTFVLHEGTVEEGKLSFELKGKKLTGAFALVRMKGLPKATGKEWLLMKKKDAAAKDDFVLQTELTPAKLKTLKERIPPCETE
jgi:bifunctional non-homologous end joining protein LigD